MPETVALDYHSLGDASKPLLVFLHGLTQNRATWAGIVEPHIDDWHVVLPDHRGHGASPRADTYLANDFIDDAAALLGKLGADVDGRQAVIVGHSLGGLAACGLAARYPQLVRSILAEDPPLFHGEAHRLSGTVAPLGGRFAMQADALDALHGRRALFDEFVAFAGASANPHGGTTADRLTHEALVARAEAFRDVDPAALRSAATGAMWADYDESATFTTPGWIIGAEARLGAVLDRNQCERVKAMMPHLEVTSMDGAAHNIHTDIETRAAFVDILQRFLDSTRSTS